jgi:DNA-binding NtrC family response regulator
MRGKTGSVRNAVEEDLPLLADHFLDRLAQQGGTRLLGISRRALPYKLSEYKP